MRLPEWLGFGRSRGAAPVAVVGCHRSGTSVVTNILARSGLSLGPERDVLVAADDENPTGYWENAAVQEVNEAVFCRTGGAWFDPADLPPEWRRSPDFAPLLERAREIVRRAGPGFLCKDPRTSVHLPLWLEAARDLRLVLVLRRPLEVALSLERRRFRIERELGLLLWLEYTLRALRHGAAHMACIVSYDALFEDPGQEAALLAGSLGLAAGGVDAAVRKVVDCGLRETAGAERLPGELAPLDGLHARLAEVRDRQSARGLGHSPGLCAVLSQLGVEETWVALADSLRKRCAGAIAAAAARAAGLARGAGK